MLLLSHDKVLLLNEFEVREKPALSVSLGEWDQISEHSLCSIFLLFTSKMFLICFVKIGLEVICISPWFYCILYVEVCFYV